MFPLDCSLRESYIFTTRLNTGWSVYDLLQDLNYATSLLYIASYCPIKQCKCMLFHVCCTGSTGSSWCTMITSCNSGNLPHPRQLLVRMLHPPLFLQWNPLVISSRTFTVGVLLRSSFESCLQTLGRATWISTVCTSIHFVAAFSGARSEAYSSRFFPSSISLVFHLIHVIECKPIKISTQALKIVNYFWRLMITRLGITSTKPQCNAATWTNPALSQSLKAI